MAWKYLRQFWTIFVLRVKINLAELLSSRRTVKDMEMAAQIL